PPSHGHDHADDQSRPHSIGPIAMKTKTILSALALAASFALPLQAETIKHVQGELEINAVPQKVIGYSLAALDTLDVLGVTVDGLAGGTLPPYLARYETNGAERV